MPPAKNSREEKMACKKSIQEKGRVGNAAFLIDGATPVRDATGRALLPLLTEQRQDVLAVLVGNRQSLNAQLLLNLQRSKAGRFCIHIGINQ